MKKIIAIIGVVVLISCLAIVLTGCGGDENTTTTTTNNITTTENITENPGMVTDESESDENGIIGDMVTDMSEMASDMMTDVSEDLPRMAR